MSDFDDTAHDDKMECPYCGHSYQPESEDYSEDEICEECEECGKHYFSYQSFNVTHFARPDCVLNSVSHNYEPVTLRNGKTYKFCSVCGKAEPFKVLGYIKE